MRCKISYPLQTLPTCLWPFWDLIFITANFPGRLVTNGGLELVYEHPPGVLAAVELPHQGVEGQVGRAHVLRHTPLEGAAVSVWLRARNSLRDGSCQVLLFLLYPS